MTDIKITIDDEQVRRELNRLVRDGADLSPVMQEIAGLLEAEAQQAFDAGESPDGKPWADLSDTTKRRRAAGGTWPGQILNVTGALSNSITSSFGSDFAVAGTNLIYASTHQFGAAKGAFGSTSRGAPIPWGDIPARPFLGLGADGEAEVVDILRRHLLPGAVT